MKYPYVKTRMSDELCKFSFPDIPEILENAVDEIEDAVLAYAVETTLTGYVLEGCKIPIPDKNSEEYNLHASGYIKLSPDTIVKILLWNEILDQGQTLVNIATIVNEHEGDLADFFDFSNDKYEDPGISEKLFTLLNKEITIALI
jgi:hypothetical protein